MFKANCADLGMDCDFMAEGKTREEVKNKMMEHGMHEHAEIMNALSEREMMEMDAKLDSIIKEKT